MLKTKTRIAAFGTNYFRKRKIREKVEKTNSQKPFLYK
jgi:hypothetical protein